MNSTFEKLHKSLNEFSPGTISVDAKAFGGNTVSSTSVQVPRSVVIESNLEEMYDYFSKIKYNVYEDLLEARNDQEWLGKLKSDFDRNIAQLRTELEKVKAEYNHSPDMYPRVKIKEDGDLLFIDYFNTTGVFAGDLLSKDIVEWIMNIDKKK